MITMASIRSPSPLSSSTADDSTAGSPVPQTPVRRIRAVGRGLRDVDKHDPPRLTGPGRTPTLGAGQVKREGVGFRHAEKHSKGVAEDASSRLGERA